MKEARHIEVVPYNSDWPHQFEVEAARIKKRLEKECLAVHHIGSTSIPGLCAKPKLDIIVATEHDPANSIAQLEAIGYEYRGEYNIPMHYGFRKRTPVSINLHVYEKNHPEIELNLTFRDFLRNNPNMREVYAARKEELLKDPNSYLKVNSQFTGYNLGKDALIRSILNLAGYSGRRMVKCYHQIEKQAVAELLAKLSLPPVLDHEWNYDSKTQSHLVFTLGTQVIGYCHLKFPSPTQAQLNTLIIDPEHQNQGHGTLFLSHIQAWLRSRHFHTLSTPNHPPTNAFFTKHSFHQTAHSPTKIL